MNNAAYRTAIEKLDDYTAEHIDRCYPRNVFAMFYLAKAAVPHTARPGRASSATSIQAYDPSPNLLDYASTKSAIIGFTKALSKLVAPKGSGSTPSLRGRSGRRSFLRRCPRKRRRTLATTRSSTVRPSRELAPVYVLLASAMRQLHHRRGLWADGRRPPY